MKLKEVLVLQESSTPPGFIWDTNMADFSLFRNTNTEVVTSCAYAIVGAIKRLLINYFCQFVSDATQGNAVYSVGQRHRGKLFSLRSYKLSAVSIHFKLNLNLLNLYDSKRAA